MWTYWLNQQTKLALAHVDWMLGAPKLKRRFLKRHGYRPNLENPKTFSEKIQWRKLYDKNPIFPVLSNKYLVRQYIADRLGQDRAQALLVPLLQYTEDPDTLDFEALPTQFVLKASHGSGMNLIVEDATQLDQQTTLILMRKWLMRHYRVRDHEWNYTKTPRGILVEELIASPEQLVDFHMDFFEGKLFDFMLIERTGETTLKTRFDAEAMPLDVQSPKAANNPRAVLPRSLEEMVGIGEILARGLDYVRVDFMTTPERFYLGEMSLMTGSGLIRPEPPDFDDWLGSAWTLPRPVTETVPSKM
jgi:hypothetical protein